MPTDPWVLVFAYTFEGVLALLSVLLILSYLTLARMNKDVRRARMFIMADRIHRFIGAFTAGFVALAVYIAVGIAGAQIPTEVATFVVFFFLGAITYGIVEIYFVIRPRKAKTASGHTPSRPDRTRPAIRPSPDVDEGGGDAPR